MCSSHGCAPIHRACRLLKVKQKCWADLGPTCSYACLANIYQNVQNWRKDELHHCCPLVPATFDVIYARICSYLLVLVSLILAGPKDQLKHWGQSQKRICFEKKNYSFKQLTLLWVQGNVFWFFKHLTLQKPLKVCILKRIFDKCRCAFLPACICRLWLVFQPGGSLVASVQQRPHWLGPCPFRQSCTQTRLFLTCSLATAACFCKAVTCLLMSTGRRLQSLAAHCWVFKNWFWMPKFLFEEGAFVALPSRRHTEAQRASPLYVRQMHLCLHIIAFFGCMLCNLTFIRELDGGILLKTG